MAQDNPNKNRTDRLPPGQSLVSRWPVLDLGYRPEIKLEDWKLEISGLVEKPFTLSWKEFMALPQVALTEDMHCVTAWSMYDNVWEGVRVTDLLAMAKPKPEAKFTVQYGYDGYTVNNALEDLQKDNVLIVHARNGEPLTLEHGGPARLIIPHLYAWKGSKFIKKIELLDRDEPGFWEVRGYNNHGDPWREERYS